MSMHENDGDEPLQAEQQNVSGWTAFLKCCGVCCYVSCPPVPEIISRKVAFHPPKKGHNYTLKSKKDPEREVKSANELVGEEFSIHPICPQKFDPNGNLQRLMMTQIEPLIIHDARGHNIVAVKSSAFPEISNESKQVIIFAQPNSSDIGSFLHPAVFNIVRMSEMFECDVYAFDYSGYGYSSGVTSEKNVYANIEAMFNYVKERNPLKKIVLIGYSLGTAVMTYMASKQPAALSGLILLAPFTSGMRIFTNKPEEEKSSFLDRFKTRYLDTDNKEMTTVEITLHNIVKERVERIKDINVPVLLIHGTDDDVIPVAHSVRLHSMLKHPVPPLFLHGADHQSIFSLVAYPTFIRIRNFMADETFLNGVPASKEEGQSEGTTSTNKRDSH